MNTHSLAATWSAALLAVAVGLIAPAAASAADAPAPTPPLSSSGPGEVPTWDPSADGIYGGDDDSAGEQAPDGQTELASYPAVSASRIAGRNRVDTAVLISRRAFPSSFGGNSGSVYLSRSDVFADALAAGTLPDGPVLLVPSCGSVPSSVAGEIARLNPKRVVALGGTGSVCNPLLSAAAGSRNTDRLAGPDRWATSRAIGDERISLGAASVVYVASGATKSPDAVAGGVLTDGPIITVGSNESMAKTKYWIKRYPQLRSVVALGGTSAISDSRLRYLADGLRTSRVSGKDRYATSVAIAERKFARYRPVAYIARGDAFADAVAAGALRDGPVYLTSSCELPESVSRSLASRKPRSIVVLGGASAVCTRALRQAAESAKGSVTYYKNIAVEPGTYLMWHKSLNRALIVRNGRVDRYMPVTDLDWKTPKGNYSIRYHVNKSKYTSEDGRVYNIFRFAEFGPIPGHSAIGFHEVPVTDSGRTIQPYSTVGDTSGKWVSHGCIRLKRNDAKAMYSFASLGRQVRVR